MHILLCNERFLFRYGVDRVLLIMAEYLRKQGDTVSIMGINIDMEIAKTVADNVIQIPNTDDYYNINEHVNDWLQKNWDNAFAKIGSPDLALDCGWPFFIAIPFMARKTKGVIFHDYGIVPVYQYEGGTMKIQEKVRALRQQYMRYSSYVITISDYITKTTYEIKEEFNIPVKTIHLGVDHMDRNLWNASQLKNTADSNAVRGLMEDLIKSGRRIILNLGRWENVGYKNSPIMYDVIRKIRQRIPDIALLTLAQPSDMQIPEELQNNIFPLGFVSDEDLVYAMKNANLGIAPTLWEGFNLPLAEMQYYGKKVLVFNVGAHPEVVTHPWYLCDNLDEMAEKAVMCIEDRDLKPWIIESAYKRFKEYFTWEKCTRKCYEVFQKVLNNDKYNVPLDTEYLLNAVKTESIIVDMTNPSRDPANPGIIRVCRRLAAEMQKYIDPIFVIWSEPDKAYVLPTLHEYQIMGTYNGPRLFDDMRLSPDEYRITLLQYLENRTPKKDRWMFLPDIIFMEKGYDVRKYCVKNKFHIADIFYDDIPYKLKDIYSQERQDEHAKYMIRLADSDFVSSISDYSTKCISDFYNKVGISNSNIQTIELPGEFNSTERITEVRIPDGYPIQFLCVSTLEPRKNHRVLINACLLLEKNHPELNFKLVMIGNKYPGHFDIAEYAEEISQKSKHIQWLGIVSDDVMKEEMEKSTFTVYPSMMEGYGMPIMESIWQGKPCLCFEEGAMGELASGGGCYTADVNNVEDMAQALYHLCTDRELINRLTHEATKRKIITWEEYTEKTLKTFLMEENRLNRITMPDRRYAKPVVKSLNVKSISECIVETAVRKLMPSVSVSIGIHDENLLNVVDCYSDITFSISNKPEDCKGKSKNIIRITGEYTEVNKEIAENIHKYELKTSCCLADCNVIDQNTLEQLMLDKVYDVFVLLNCNRILINASYEVELEEKGIVCLRSKGACLEK